MSSNKNMNERASKKENVLTVMSDDSDEKDLTLN